MRTHTLTDLLISYASLAAFLAFGTLERIVIIYPDVTLQFYISLAVAITLLSWPAWKRYSRISSYFAGLSMSMFILLASASVLYPPQLMVFPVVGFAINVREYLKDVHGVYERARPFAFMAIYSFMYLIGGVVRLTYSPADIGVSLASIYDDVSPKGVTAFYQWGVVLFTRRYTLTSSLQTFILFTFLSAVLTDNYLSIISYLRGSRLYGIGGTFSSFASALSCQCESIVASFPSLVVLLISVFVFPLIIESAAFVSATNYLITSRYSMGIDVFSGRLRFTGMRRYTLVSGILLVLCMAAISIGGVSLGLQRSVYFFFGSDMSLFALSLLFFVNGMKGFRVRMGRGGTTYTLAVAAAILMILWFVPPFTYNAYTSPVYFSLMGISAFLSAFLTSLSYLSLDEQARHVYMEFVAMMFSMVALVVFYVTVVGGRVVWGGCSRTSSRSSSHCTCGH